jgi:hypothetical protein
VVEFGVDGQPGVGGGSADQVDDDLVADAWAWAADGRTAAVNRDG